MPTFKFANSLELDNVIAQLPPSAVGPDSGFMSRPLDDGKYELTVPGQWVGAVKSADPKRAPPEPVRTVRKSTVMNRLTDAGKINAAFAALMVKPELFARWFAADRPHVNSNDPDTIAFLKSLEVDPDAILAKEDA